MDKQLDGNIEKYTDTIFDFGVNCPFNVNIEVMIQIKQADKCGIHFDNSLVSLWGRQPPLFDLRALALRSATRRTWRPSRSRSW